MRLVKNFNNNAALVKDQQDNEWVVIGKGISFVKSVGDPIDDDRIERRFKADDSTENLIETATNVSPEIAEVVNQIEQLVKKRLDYSFDDYQYLSLADHIDFAIKRSQDGLNLDSATASLEMKRLFPKEYAVAEEALQLINGLTGAGLESSEAAMLTQHFINAGDQGATIQDTIKISRLIRGLVDILQYQYQIQLDHDSFNFTRFIGHLRAFMIRQLTQTELTNSELDESLIELVKLKYPEAAMTVDRFAVFLKKQMNWDISEDERFFLILHVWRVTHHQED
ncbi:antitermination protein BlgG [Lactiplantibacillus pentosus]|uniref:PRD domain-containing protein n=1 Tax=Lactiplantibacillus pentosus TaxID=1589 RepID=UPI000D014626|nr:PRD domain-containing protein [Lactiplantibacillus pentosus]PRO83810.1 antitermination protein BlgG [Lactiplantibacillus pentosus]